MKYYYDEDALNTQTHISVYLILGLLKFSSKPAEVAWGKSACFISGVTLHQWFESRSRHVYMVLRNNENYYNFFPRLQMFHSVFDN